MSGFSFCLVIFLSQRDSDTSTAKTDISGSSRMEIMCISFVWSIWLPICFDFFFGSWLVRIWHGSEIEARFFFFAEIFAPKDCIEKLRMSSLFYVAGFVSAAHLPIEHIALISRVRWRNQLGVSQRSWDEVIDPCLGTTFDSINEAYDFYNLHSCEPVKFGEDEMHARDCLRLLGEFVD
jgi:hypothetical protein